MYEIFLDLSIYDEKNWDSEWGFVYVWKNLINGKRYLGSHKGTPWDGYIGSGVAFKRAINKYEIHNFRRNIIYIGKRYKQIEEGYLKCLDLKNDNSYYNLKNTADGNDYWKGKKVPEDTKEKIRNTLKGRKHSENSIRKMSDAKKEKNNKGKRHTEETKTKISKGNKGKVVNEETRRKISESLREKNSVNHGKSFSEETRRKMSDAKKGKNNPSYGKIVSEETRRKLSISNKGKIYNERIVSKETRRKMSDTKKGKIVSEETRKKMSESQKNRPKLTCPHCNKQMDPGNAKQHHFDNCKYKPIL